MTDELRVEYGPIVDWPGRLLDDNAREATPFESPYRKTERLLLREARMLDARACTVRLALDGRHFYRDGTGLNARAPEPRHPGALVVIDSARLGVLTFSCDKYVRRYRSDECTSWQHNVRAIAMGLEALRQAERYGIADRGEQYAGFAAIGTGRPMTAKREAMTLDEAAALLAGAIRGTTSATVLSNRTIAASCHRTAMRLLHPDHGAPDSEEQRDKLAQLHEAWRLVDEHHRSAA